LDPVKIGNFGENMKKILSIVFVVATTLGTIVAQDITLQAEYPSTVQSGQQFNITWRVNANGGDFGAPTFDGFYKLMGPSTSYSSSTQIINGKMTRSATNSFTYILQAMEPGSYTIPSATYTVDKKTYTSDPIKIEVVASQNNQTQSKTGQSAQSSQAQSPTTSRSNVSGQQVFIDLIVNKKEVFVGEPILATAKLYTRVNLSGINDVKYPSFKNFLKTDIETPPLNNLVEENLNGTVYGTGVLQQFLLFPQVAGDITIDPMEVTALQQQRISSGNDFDSFFSDFFSSYQTVPVAVSSDPVTIKVKPLPGTIPTDFSGIVGNITLTSSIDKDTVNVNDAITFKVVVSGNGNLKIAENPLLNLSPDIELYDPNITDNLQNGSNGASGSRTFEYLLIPRQYGEFSIPAVTYSYFNTSTGKYEQLSTPEYKFYANKNGDQSSSGLTVYGGISKSDVKYVGQDIRFIKSSGGAMKQPGKLLSESGSFYSIYGFSLLLFLVLLFARREHVRRNSDITAVKNRKAGKVAAKKLKVASDCLAKSEIDRFYEEILKALWGYLSDKLSIPISNLNRSNIVETLKQKGLGEEQLNNLTAIIDTCEFARYSPSSSEAKASEILDETLGFIKFLEGNIS